MPKWISGIGLLEHFVVGTAITIIYMFIVVNPGITLLTVFIVAVAHEIGDNDLKPNAEGWPWNGLLDVIAFLPTPLLWFIFNLGVK